MIVCNEAAFRVAFHARLVAFDFLFTSFCFSNPSVILNHWNGLCSLPGMNLSGEACEGVF